MPNRDSDFGRRGEYEDERHQWRGEHGRVGREDWNERGFGEPSQRRFGREEYDERYGRAGGMGYGQDERYGRQEERWNRGYGQDERYGRQDERYGYGRGMGMPRDLSSEWGGRFGDERYGYGYGERMRPWEREREHERYGREDRSFLDRVRDFFGFGEERRYGRAPKGYQRSDERIRDDVCDRLMSTEFIDPSDVEVKVQSGEVTLTGTVTRREDKRLIEDIAERVLGVKEVHSQLRVNRTEQQLTGTTTTTTGTTHRGEKTPRA